MSTSRAPYAALAQDADEVELKEHLLEPDQPTEVSSAGSPPPQSWHISPFIRYSVYIILICTLFDAVIVSYIAFQYVRLQKQPTASSSSDEFELRSTYVNFDKLYGLDGGQQSLKPAPHEPIVNLPRAWAQVSRAEPDKVFEMWPESWMSEHGLIPNDERRLWVTTEFRVIDYGMENCSITVAIPALTSSSIKSFSPSSATSGSSSSPNVHLEIYSLDTTSKLDLSTLSWKTKPARSTHLGTLVATPGTTAELSSAFICKRGTYVTVEVTCPDEDKDCTVEVVNDAPEAVGEIFLILLLVTFTLTNVMIWLPGLYMKQYQTL
ncbi:uncharacterized protein STEHIDRAFT_142122 [Stereum hirsutum FP-91666 SS1]|uniref:uncharacterized protein n=1 Tax=Stereum hirsutum (strain FP-91666) TaxID=721885 RepID=UPI0004449AE0|nr:uncharacterized protein STEHIDRAFT_142122 [Stereum hirsutum FP-91666 SS1]EIM81462.1 hypothetical protein STEHIDRAFT_142122 [Stereum hirsutum FP-91666 SS1]